MSTDRADLLREVCACAAAMDLGGAAGLLAREYPFERMEPSRRRLGASAALRVFRRDGFVDRYSGKRLLFPGVLRLLSALLPREFPYQRNWKVSETHPAYWELYPTLDHIDPVARSGLDADSNWLTTSMLRNSAKSHWTLRDLGWTVHPCGDLKEWDGMEGWFVAFVEAHPDIAGAPGIGMWIRASRAQTG